MSATTVLIADSDSLYRQGLRSVLQAEGLAVVAETSSATETLEVVAEQSPDIALIGQLAGDVSMLDLVATLVSTTDITTLVLAVGQRSSDLQAAARQGAHGYLLKSSPGSVLAAGVRQAAATGATADPLLATTLFAALRERCATSAASTPTDCGVGAASPDRRRADSLTVRELAILQQVARGSSNAQIALTLGIAPDTVKNHLANVRKKLGVRSRTEAVVAAAKAGVLDLS